MKIKGEKAINKDAVDRARVTETEREICIGGDVPRILLVALFFT